MRVLSLDTPEIFRVTVVGWLKMLDQKRMANTRFDGVRGRFFDDGGIERAPAYVSAVGNEAVIRPEHPSRRLANGKNRIHTRDHRVHLLE